jgi:hypothetical protein
MNKNRHIHTYILILFCLLVDTYSALLQTMRVSIPSSPDLFLTPRVRNPPVISSTKSSHEKTTFAPFPIKKTSKSCPASLLSNEPTTNGFWEVFHFLDRQLYSDYCILSTKSEITEKHRTQSARCRTKTCRNRVVVSSFER